MEHGLLTDDFLDQLLQMGEEEQAEALMEELEELSGGEESGESE